MSKDAVGKLELRKEKQRSHPQKGGGEAQLKETRMNQVMMLPNEMQTSTAKVGKVCQGVSEWIGCLGSHVRDTPTGNANKSGSWSDLGELLMSVMEIQEGLIHEIRKTKHERVSKAAGTGTVFHFLGEDIGGVDFPRNMDDIQSFVLYPFLNGIFMKLNVTSHFWGHNVQPLDTSIVVIVQKCGKRETFNGVAAVEVTATEIS